MPPALALLCHARPQKLGVGVDEGVPMVKVDGLMSVLASFSFPMSVLHAPDSLGMPGYVLGKPPTAWLLLVPWLCSVYLASVHLQIQ